jgi:hypothetical protein
VVSVGTKPPLVHVVEALTQEYCFPVTKSLPRAPLGVRPEVELIRGVQVEAKEGVGVRVVAGGGVGVRVVLGYRLLAGPASSGSLRVGPANVAWATCEALAGWGSTWDG